MAQEELQESKLTKAGGRKPTHGCNYPMVGWPSVILTPMGPSLNLTREGTSRPSLRSSLSLSLCCCCSSCHFVRPHGVDCSCQCMVLDAGMLPAIELWLIGVRSYVTLKCYCTKVANFWRGDGVTPCPHLLYRSTPCQYCHLPFIYKPTYGQLQP